jgi:hypothetical protein
MKMSRFLCHPFPEGHGEIGFDTLRFRTSELGGHRGPASLPGPVDVTQLDANWYDMMGLSAASSEPSNTFPRSS